jgi:hypothetical protein
MSTDLVVVALSMLLTITGAPLGYRIGVIALFSRGFTSHQSAGAHVARGSERSTRGCGHRSPREPASWADILNCGPFPIPFALSDWIAFLHPVRSRVIADELTCSFVASQ